MQSDQARQTYLITCDQVVLYDGQIREKPIDAQQVAGGAHVLHMCVLVVIRVHVMYPCTGQSMDSELCNTAGMHMWVHARDQHWQWSSSRDS